MGRLQAISFQVHIRRQSLIHQPSINKTSLFIKLEKEALLIIKRKDDGARKDHNNLVPMVAGAVSMAVHSHGSSRNKFVAKSGCNERCGDVIVPYPFGIDKPDCAKNEAFLLDCNRTTTPPKLYIFEYSFCVQHIGGEQHSNRWHRCSICLLQ
jgi:hypothetical protein